MSELVIEPSRISLGLPEGNGDRAYTLHKAILSGSTTFKKEGEIAIKLTQYAPEVVGCFLEVRSVSPG